MEKDIPNNNILFSIDTQKFTWLLLYTKRTWTKSQYIM